MKKILNFIILLTILVGYSCSKDTPQKENIIDEEIIRQDDSDLSTTRNVNYSIETACQSYFSTDLNDYYDGPRVRTADNLQPLLNLFINQMESSRSFSWPENTREEFGVPFYDMALYFSNENSRFIRLPVFNNSTQKIRGFYTIGANSADNFTYHFVNRDINDYDLIQDPNSTYLQHNDYYFKLFDYGACVSNDVPEPFDDDIQALTLCLTGYGIGVIYTLVDCGPCADVDCQCFQESSVVWDTYGPCDEDDNSTNWLPSLNNNPNIIGIADNGNTNSNANAARFRAARNGLARWMDPYAQQNLHQINLQLEDGYTACAAMLEAMHLALENSDHDPGFVASMNCFARSLTYDSETNTCSGSMNFPSYPANPEISDISDTNIDWSRSFFETCNENNAYYNNPLCDLIELGYSGKKINSLLTFYRNSLDPSDGQPGGAFVDSYNVCEINEITDLLLAGTPEDGETILLNYRVDQLISKYGLSEDGYDLSSLVGNSCLYSMNFEECAINSIDENSDECTGVELIWCTNDTGVNVSPDGLCPETFGFVEVGNTYTCQVNNIKFKYAGGINRTMHVGTICIQTTKRNVFEQSIDESDAADLMRTVFIGAQAATEAEFIASGHTLLSTQYRENFLINLRIGMELAFSGSFNSFPPALSASSGPCVGSWSGRSPKWSLICI